MTEYAVGQSVRTRIDVIDTDSGDRIPEGAIGMIVGFQGHRLVVSLEDAPTGTRVHVVVAPSEVNAVTPRAVR